MCVDPVYPFSRKLARKQENPSAATDKSKPAAKVLSARKLCSVNFVAAITPQAKS